MESEGRSDFGWIALIVFLLLALLFVSGMVLASLFFESAGGPVGHVVFAVNTTSP